MLSKHSRNGNKIELPNQNHNNNDNNNNNNNNVMKNFQFYWGEICYLFPKSKGNIL
jgi:hypothetical protein